MVTMDRIDQMTREAQQTQEGELEQLQAGDVLPITGVQVNKASQIVTIYQRETGEPRQLPRLAAEIALKKRYKNRLSPLFGQFIFAARATKPYFKGEVKCLLHQSNPERKQYDTWGLPVCASEHLASPGELRRHMELRHTSAWGILEKRAEDAKHQAELEAQQATASAIIEAMNRMGKATGTAPKKRRRRGPNKPRE